MVNVNTAMNIYKGVGQWWQPLELLGSSNLQPDMVSTNTCIAACQPIAWRSALQLAENHGVDATGAVALLACEAGWLWAQALRLFWRLAELSLELSLRLCTSVTTICEINDEWRSAISLYSSLWVSGACPDVVAIGATLSALRSRWRESQGLLGLSMRTSLRSNVIIMSAAITACEKGFQWDLALHLLLAIKAAVLRPNAFSLAATASALEKSHHWIAAIVALDTFEEHKNQVSVNAALSACEKATAWQSALSAWDAKEADVVALSATLSALASAAEWLPALQLLQEAQVTPNEVSYSAVITACEKVGHWQLAFALLDEMVEQKLQPDAFAFNAATAACLRAVELRAVNKEGGSRGSILAPAQLQVQDNQSKFG
ncbi:unnamed protein product [Durusdinium trenchii]